jgi:hypothetical protein
MVRGDRRPEAGVVRLGEETQMGKIARWAGQKMAERAGKKLTDKKLTGENLGTAMDLLGGMAEKAAKDFAARHKAKRRRRATGPSAPESDTREVS